MPYPFLYLFIITGKNLDYIIYIHAYIKILFMICSFWHFIKKYIEHLTIIWKSVKCYFLTYIYFSKFFLIGYFFFFFLQSFLNLLQHCLCLSSLALRHVRSQLPAWLGIKPTSPALEGKVPTTGPPWNSFYLYLNKS